ncbi:MAG: hypothetical protein HY459_03015 [Parcubacteria group bacterium]|nr:hypothetical protein [Parcubacteria group bacterium]
MLSTRYSRWDNCFYPWGETALPILAEQQPPSIPTPRRIYAKILVSSLFVFFFAWFGVGKARAAVLSLSPGTGTFPVGNTFEVSLYLNTEGDSVNTIEAYVQFPPDKLQLVSPSAGQSIIGIWVSQPKFNNQTGTTELQGGIPGGITTSSGLVTKFVFRVKSTGSAIVKIQDRSRVLLNDGLGTDVLRQTGSGIFQLTLPPPAGPTVVSETHPEQSRWYPISNVILRWEADTEVEGYSYIVSREPVDIPDDISEGLTNSVVYRDLEDGTNYFHIKALRKSVWGGITHYALNIDTLPPALFPIEILPGARTSRREPIIQFETTDALSGNDHYELKLVPLTQGVRAQSVPGAGDQPLFIEVASPYITANLELGSYDVIVRAYDKAGNFQESVKRLAIVTSIFRFVSERGLEIKSTFIIPWYLFWLFLGLIIVAAAYLAWRLHRWHRHFDVTHVQKHLPEHVRKQFEELKRYRAKYGKIAVLLLLALGLAFRGAHVKAEEASQIELGPPFVTTLARNISNEEIFYIGGKTEVANSQVIIFLQNLGTGETVSQTVTSDKKSDWFYRHHTFLTSGNYLLWTQSKVGELTSPPSPQMQLTVRQTAIQFGASRVSFETLYFLVTLVLFTILVVVAGYAIFHGYHGRRKHRRLMKEIKEAEDSVRRGFAVLRRDIEAELSVVRKAKLTKALSEEEKTKEEQLLRDLAWVEKYVGKEIWDIEEAEH